MAYALNAEEFVDDVPQNYEEIDEREDKEAWKKAIQEEMTSLIENKTWKLEQLPAGKKAINNKWVFKIKKDEDGNPLRYKARLVNKGCAQQKGLDYKETYALVARITTVRILLSIINHKDLIAHQMDVKNVFLQGNVHEDIYMKIPAGLNIRDKNLVCKLCKPLYGLRQAPREWNFRFDNFIKKLEFKQSKADSCLYIYEKGTIIMYLLLYVDDFIIACNNLEFLKAIKERLMKEFKMTDLGELKFFLGIKIERKPEGMYLSQCQYILNLLNRFNMSYCKPVRTPLEEDFLCDDILQEPVISDKPFRELIGCLMYLMNTSRPDLSFSVNRFSRFQNHPTEVFGKDLNEF